MSKTIVANSVPVHAVTVGTRLRRIGTVCTYDVYIDAETQAVSFVRVDGPTPEIVAASDFVITDVRDDTPVCVYNGFEMAGTRDSECYYLKTDLATFTFTTRHGAEANAIMQCVAGKVWRRGPFGTPNPYPVQAPFMPPQPVYGQPQPAYMAGPILEPTPPADPVGDAVFAEMLARSNCEHRFNSTDHTTTMRFVVPLGDVELWRHTPALIAHVVGLWGKALATGLLQKTEFHPDFSDILAFDTVVTKRMDDPQLDEIRVVSQPTADVKTTGRAGAKGVTARLS